MAGLGLSRLSALSSFSSLWAVSSEMGAGGGDGVPSSWLVGIDAWVDGDGASALTVGGVPVAVDAGDVGVEVAHPALPALPLEVADRVLTSPALGCSGLARVLPMGGDWVVLTVVECPWVLAGLRVEEWRELEVVIQPCDGHRASPSPGSPAKC